jgi:multidrug resistance efflux pump
VCLVLLGIGSIVLAALVRTRPLPSSSSAAVSAPRVQVMRADPVAVRRRWTGYGTARAMDSADIPARVTATVVLLPPEIQAGAEVNEGDVIARLDDSDFARQVEIAENNIADIDAQLTRLLIEKASWEERVKLAAEEVELSRAEYERVQAAEQRGAANPREVDSARQSLIQVVRAEVIAREERDKVAPRESGLKAMRLAQEATRRIARQDVERCEIVSPIEGVLQLVDVEVGENLASGQRLARVVSLRRIEVPLRLPASARGRVGPGDDVRLDASDRSGLSWEAVISRISPADDERTRTLSCYVEVDQDPRAPTALPPGKFVRGTVLQREPEERTVVPRRALQGSRLLLVEHGAVRSVPAEIAFQVEAEFEQLGLPDRQWVVLAEPLDPGTLVVVTASRSLVDGLPVTPVTVSPSPVAAASTASEPAPEPAP